VGPVIVILLVTGDAETNTGPPAVEDRLDIGKDNKEKSNCTSKMPIRLAASAANLCRKSAHRWR
jgi:hypothetical protein